MAATPVPTISMLPPHPHHYPSNNNNNNNNDDVDKLTFEIFSILENKFLFGYNHSKPNNAPNSLSPAPGSVRILSLDAGGSTDGVLAAKSLLHLEATLRRKSGNPNAHVADFFDVVAGAGAGGLLAALLVTRGRDGRPIFTAHQALQFLLQNARKFSRHAPAGLLGRLSRHSKAEELFLNVFGDLTLKDTLKPVLIPCYDLSTGSPFLFSRADALEMEGCDFRMVDVCRATMANRALEMRSTDGRKKMAAVGGGLAMNNPTAAAIAHVLNNKQEFPFCKGVENLVVVSLGNGEMDCAAGNHKSSPAAYLSIAGDGAADMVDQAVSMAFGQWRTSNYVRIQGNGIVGKTSNDNSSPTKCNEKKRKGVTLDIIADQMLAQKNVESVLFQGKKLVESTNLEKLEYFGGELIKEQEWRKTSVLPPVILKHSPTSFSSPPRSSSATTTSTISSS